MACNCKKEVEEKLLTKFKENYKQEDCNEVSYAFENEVLEFTKGTYAIVLPFKLDYTYTKKNGEQSRTQYWKVNMGMAFCPFCGKKFEEGKEDKENEVQDPETK